MVQSLGARMAERRQAAVESVFVGAGRQVEQESTVVQPQPIHKGVAWTMIPQCGADVSEGCIITDMDNWVTCEQCMAMCSRHG